MQTEVDVISQEWETAQGKRKSPGSVDLNTQRSKDIARAPPQGWKQRGQEGALDGEKIRSAHKGVATRAFAVVGNLPLIHNNNVIDTLECQRVSLASEVT